MIERQRRDCNLPRGRGHAFVPEQRRRSACQRKRPLPPAVQEARGRCWGGNFLAAATARDDEAEADDRRGDGADVERRAAADGQRATGDARLALRGALAVRAVHAAARIDLDVEGREVGEAVVDVGRVHVLAVAEERALGLAALGLAAALELALAAHVAVDLRLDVARAAAAGVALGLAGGRGRRPLALGAARGVAPALAASGAVLSIRRGIAASFALSLAAHA